MGVLVMSARRLPRTITRSIVPVMLGAAMLATTAIGMRAAPTLAARTPLMGAGELAGPVPVLGGGGFGTVASLSVAPGNWAFFAKGVLRNTTGSPTARPVRCRLAFGSGRDLVLASPAARDRGGSRQVFLLTHAAHIDTAATAILSCGAPGSRTGDIVVENVRMVAFKSAALGRRKGTLETTTGNADAMSQVRLLIGGDALVSGEIRTVASLPLPAGRWAITAKASLDQPTPRDQGTVRCAVGIGTDYGVTVGSVRGQGQPGDRTPIALEMVHSDDASFEARLDCQDLSDGGTTHIRDIRLVAYRARAVANQELDPSATYSDFPAWMKPVVFAGYDRNLREVPADTGYATINQMSLPGASWVVVAAGIIEQGAAQRRDVSCRVGRGSDHDDVDLRLGPEGTASASQPFTITWAGSFSGQRAVRLTCSADGSDVRIYYLTMTAYKAGTLAEAPPE
jgi:hypothetical protein